jgi:hypothetical protein
MPHLTHLPLVPDYPVALYISFPLSPQSILLLLKQLELERGAAYNFVFLYSRLFISTVALFSELAFEMTI